MRCAIFALTMLTSLSTWATANMANYPTCIDSRSIADLSNVRQKIVICPKGVLLARVLPATHYANYVLPYNAYCSDIKLKFSTCSANVLIDNYQYFYKILYIPGGRVPKGTMQLPNIVTKAHTEGVVKITNLSDTAVCLGQQCLY